MDPPQKKRRLSDNGCCASGTMNKSTSLPLEEAVSYQRGSIWFDDGGLILVAGNIQFRVHASLLSRFSSVFQDMLSVPQPPNPEGTIEGCPVVHLHDSPKDLEYVLTAIYDNPYSADIDSPIKPMKFSMVSALLRLGNKYDIPQFRDHALSRLRHVYPCAYNPIFNRKASHYIELEPAMLFDTARLASEEGLLSIIPSILHILIVGYETQIVLSGCLRADRTRATLPEPLLHQCIIGKEKLGKLMCSDSYQFLKQRKTVQCHTWNVCLETMRCLADEIWQPAPELRYALVYSWDNILALLANRNLKFCNHCSSKLSECHQEGRKVVWEALPSIFGFDKTWDELKAMDRV
ncbi:hypothetical protein BJ165DRAFT_1396182 [Panaeolus papilionaceus]|nr:hypothetical protein BJ165DRAFT_1396182 [Panaeolus papilionaceus]